MNIDFNKYLKNLKEKIGDNGEREASFSPCSCFEAKENCIDNPPFEENEWKKFWALCKHYYPLHSVCGGNGFSDEAKILVSEQSRFITHFFRLHNTFKSLMNLRILEIGYGFGGAGLYALSEGAFYRGIDYVASNKNRLFPPYFNEISKSGIPSDIARITFDLVYSTNVFQHLTRNQRFEYIRQAYDVLEEGGILYFDVFERNPEWNGGFSPAYSTLFFNVQTKVDERYELSEYIKSVGFNITEIGINSKICNETNSVYYICKK